MSRLRGSTLTLVVSTILSLTALMAVNPPTAQAAYRVNHFVAIAYSPSTGGYGYTSAALTLPAAEAAAIANCGACDARIVVWVENGWAAFAVSPNGAIGYGISRLSLAQAEAIALSGCAQTDCPGSVVAWAASL
jgi:hypothetical protein